MNKLYVNPVDNRRKALTLCAKACGNGVCFVTLFLSLWLSLCVSVLVSVYLSLCFSVCLCVEVKGQLQL